MRGGDRWGNDPSVQIMRRIFSAMEVEQDQLLKKLKISRFDSRLRGFRETARSQFERVWPIIVRKTGNMDENEAREAYIHCLARAIRQNDIEVPQSILPTNANLDEIFREARL